MTNLLDKKKEKRDRILQSAIDLFSKKGYAETTISDVARRQTSALAPFSPILKRKRHFLKRLSQSLLRRSTPCF